MRALLPATLLALSGSAQATQLEMFMSGKKIGTGTYSSTLTKTGGVRTTFTMNISLPNASFSSSQSSECDASGKPQSESEQSTNKMKKPDGTWQTKNESEQVVYKGLTAFVVTLKDGKKGTRTVVAPKNANIADQSELWFIKLKPKPGASVKYCSFGVQQLKWETSTTKYDGVREVTLNGQKRRAHLLLETHGEDSIKAYYDDKGKLLKMEMRGLTVVAK